MGGETKMPSKRDLRYACAELERARAIKEFAEKEADRMMEQYASLIPDDWKD